MIQFSWQVSASGQAVALGGLPQVPQPYSGASFWKTGWARESRTMAEFFSVQPTSFLHSHVVSLGWTSGFSPGVWAVARPKRAEAAIKESVEGILSSAKSKLAGNTHQKKISSSLGKLLTYKGQMLESIPNASSYPCLRHNA